MASQPPPPLARLLQPPETYLVLLTNTVDTTTNWLVLEYLRALLGRSSSDSTAPLGPVVADAAEEPRPPRTDDGGAATAAPVVLVSFLRNYRFWKESASRLGVDLDARVAAGRLVFVDGLAGLLPPFPSLPPGRPQATATPKKGRLGLDSSSLDSLEQGLVHAIDQIHGGKPVVIMDGLDLVLASAPAAAATATATATATSPGAGLGPITGPGLRSLLLRLRSKAHACILAVAADDSLVADRAAATALEQEHGALVRALAHSADRVISVGPLRTGVSHDLSGVIRITGGGRTDLEVGEDMDGQEYVYLVAGDGGGVRVFERGQ